MGRGAKRRADPAFASFTAPHLGGNLDPPANSSRGDKMNNYYPVIARAVERLDRSTGETRRAVYERAREAIAQLRSNQPALLDADIIKERLALEEAILKVEAGAVRNLVTQTGAEPRWAPPSGDMSVGDKIQTGDHGQPASPDPDDRPPASSSRQAPVFSPTASDHWHIQAVAIGGAYGADHYYDDVTSSRWRGGFLGVMAVLALALLAGSFAYRGMFGGSVFAALPPILKGVSRPDNFVIRNNSDALRRNSSQTSVTSAGSSEKPPPIGIREAPKTVPRVISAIPISSKPSAGAIALAPAATTPALDPAVASALDQHLALSVSPPASASLPVLGSSEPNETAATAPATREQGAPTPALGPPVLTAVPVSPAASAPVPVQVSSEPTETAAVAPAAPTPVLRPPVLTALSAPPLLLASAAVPVQASSATKPAAAPAAREQGAPSPALSLPVLTAASVPPPVSAPVPVLVSLELSETPAAPAPAIGLPVLTAASVPPPASAPMPVQGSSGSKKIELVSVEDGWGQADTSSLAASAPNTATPAASAAAAPPVGNHGVQEDAAPSLSSGPAMQAAAAEVSSGGAYAVQLASESSAAEAHASFRALRSKFPNQLGGREPIVRRTDLGAKGVYYRVMVGPFASMEKAAGMCGTLKAARCNCLVQRN